MSRIRDALHARAPLSRRGFLRGAAGAALALPFLPSALPRRAWSQSFDEPTRLIFWYVPCGIQMDWWYPQTFGPDYELADITAGLAPVQADVSLISGLANLAAEEPISGDHARGTASFLSCTTIRHTAGADIFNGVSADQVAAQSLGHLTPLPSLQLGIVPGANTGDCTAGYSCAYTRNISWAGASTPLPNVTDPQIVFDRLFGVDAGLSPEEKALRGVVQASVLDRVLDDATSLQSRLGSRDQQKLDEYLTAVRELEVRVSSLGTGTCEPPERPGEGGLTLPEHVALMNELMVVALHCDLTRVVTFMLGPGGSNQTYPFLGVPEAHHQLSHHQGDAATLEKLVQIGAWEVEQFAGLVQRLADTETAEGSRLLDHTLALFSSEIEDGDTHAHRNLPVLLAGGGNGAHDAGRYWHEADDRSIADLYLSMLNGFGLSLESFGDDGSSPLTLTA
jgi:hypothetical protein